MAEARLAETLAKAGAVARVGRLPAKGDNKVGLDDFLVGHGVNGPAELQKVIDKAAKPELPATPSPMDWAKKFVEDHFTHKKGRSLKWWRDEFSRWNGRHYLKVSETELSAIVFSWLDQRRKQTKPRHASEVVKALASLCRVPFGHEQPSFLDSRRSGDPKNIIACHNGLLDIADIGGELSLTEHTPKWFSPVCLPYSFAPASECPQWEAFLADVFDGDNELVDLLQRWFGLCLISDTSYQKLLMMVGPKRSGKGTVLRVLQHIVGPDACVSPTLSSLASEFGLWQLIDKTVAMFPDAHLGKRADGIRVLEVIKSIVGEDSVSINRKSLPYLTNCRLNVRFIITVNELPRFADSALALESRLLILPFPKSYAGREDRTLEARLKAEGPGVLNWSLSGLLNLRRLDGFAMPTKAKTLMASYARIVSPVSAFLDDWFRIGPKYRVDCGKLYLAWCGWCKRNGLEPGANVPFGEHMRATKPVVARRRVRNGEARTYVYNGVELTEHGQREASITVPKRWCP